MLCACGCGQSIAPRKRTTRFANGHHNGRRDGKALALDRWHEEDRGHVTPRHIWEGAKTDRGYAVVYVSRRARKLHRVLWEREHGPVPEGYELDHLCFTHPCVRLDHLECVTKGENVRRSNARRWHGDE